ncbi:MAG TPA: insulinase family protein [Vicinamibacterales bacterium]|nr:insulinase family protein [Vicinamibacterales bacterium]
MKAIAAIVVALLATTASAQQLEWPRETPPRPLPAHDITFPPYELQTLPNGLQVVAVLHHEQPAVTMRLLVRAGTAEDPKGKYGVARLLASLLDQGTAGASPRTSQQLQDAIDFIGAEMSAGAGSDLTFVNMVVMKDSFETGMRMLSDMTRHPAFAPAEIERQRVQTLSNLQVSQQDPEWVANSVFDRLVYGFHPYGMPDAGTPETLATITRDDLVAFHQKYFNPNNAILAVVGDVTAEEAFATAKKVFGDWQKRDVAPETFIAPPEPARRVVVVDKPDAVQTEVRVGHLGVPRTSPDYMALNLAIRILGGEGSNRLHQVLRTQRSLTYGAQASFDTLKESGDIEAETNTRSEATGEVLRLMVDEFWRLQRERVSEIELLDAKAYLTGSFPLTIETPNAIAMQVMNVLFYGLPVQELQTFRERVNAVTVDDIQRVAQKYLKPDRLSIVLVGNASAFASQLRGIGFGQYETVALTDLDLTAADLKRARNAAARREPRADLQARRAIGRQDAAYAPVQGVNAEASRAAALVDQAITAKGGLDKLRGVKAIKVTQTLTSTNGDRSATVESINYIQYPDRFRIETRTPSGEMIQGFDGVEAWIKDPRGVQRWPDALARDARDSLRRDVMALLLAAKGGGVTPRALPDVRDASGHVSHALELSANDLNPVVLYIDPSSGVVTKQSFVAGPANALVEETFSDYRTVDGVQFAFSATRTIGDAVVSRRVSAIALNPPLDPSLFKRPAS